MAEKDETKRMTEVRKYREKKQENVMYTQPELQPKRLGQEETLMAGYFFRTEERHESTDIKSKTHNQKVTWKGSYTPTHCHGTA